MNISLISKIALSTFVTSITSLAIAPSAMAYNFNLSGTFDDAGTLSGTFDFDEKKYIRDLRVNNLPNSLISVKQK